MILKIFDDILNDQTAADLRFWDPGRGVCFKDIDEFLASIPEDDDTIDLRINSCGGDVNAGWAIVDKLRASGKKITATVEGMAASTASLILMAASERKAYPHSQIVIHNPYIPWWGLDGNYDAARLQKLGGELQAETERFINFYVERTGADRERIIEIMNEDRLMYADEARELGILTEVLPPLSAAFGKRNQFKLTDMAKETKKKSALAKAMAALQEALGLETTIQGYELETADGTTITIDKPEGEDPAVGDPASPDGEHQMPDGTTIVVTDGVITEIRPADEGVNEDDDESVEETAAELARLAQEVKALRAKAKTDDEQAILDAVKAAGGKDWLDKVARSGYKPAARVQTSKQPQKVATVSKTAERLAEMKEKRNA